MNNFPIKIKIVATGEITIIVNPRELPIGIGFIVLETKIAK